MPQHIILLSQPQDAPFLSAILFSHNSGLVISTAFTLEQLEQRMAEATAEARLIAFRTSVIVPLRLLKRLTGPAYNFHPASPAYPGKHPIAFALYDGAERYGATAHEMIAQVDAGPIVGAVEFPVPPDAGAEWLKDKTQQALVYLFTILAPALANTHTPLPHTAMSWSERRCSQKALEALCALPADITADEFHRRVRAVSHPEAPPLHVVLHGHRFVLAPE